MARPYRKPISCPAPQSHLQQPRAALRGLRRPQGRREPLPFQIEAGPKKAPIILGRAATRDGALALFARLFWPKPSQERGLRCRCRGRLLWEEPK